jgi:hypothetical protein
MLHDLQGLTTKNGGHGTSVDLSFLCWFWRQLKIWLMARWWVVVLYWGFCVFTVTDYSTASDMYGVP